MCYVSCDECGAPVKRSIAVLLIIDGSRLYFHHECATDEVIRRALSAEDLSKKEPSPTIT